jgi:hypothetical protein
MTTLFGADRGNGVHGSEKSRRLFRAICAMATSPVAGLDEAWCNTTYWYHEALGEILDTIVVAQLETAIEVRFRAESISGRKRRLLGSFEAIFGMMEGDFINQSSKITVGQS